MELSRNPSLKKKEMILVVDIGNTNIMTGLYQGDKLLWEWNISKERIKDKYWKGLGKYLLKLDSGRKIRSVIVSSVVPALNREFEKKLKKYLKIRPVFLNHRMDTGIKIRCRPQELGSDRIANAVAGFMEYGGPVVVVDFGTAITFDVINRKGEYLGGAIAPGLDIAVKSLYENTAKLPLIRPAKASSAIGKNTRAAIRAGVYYGAVGQVKEILNRIKRQMGWKRIKVILTGGGAGIFHKGLGLQEIHNRLLTLKGLKIIEEKRRKFEKDKEKKRKK